MTDHSPSDVDVIVVGAGAAGLFAALAARGALHPDGSIGAVPDDAPSVLLVDGAESPGKKILISGGGRCNVTNARVTADDFLTATPKLVRNTLRSFGTEQTLRAFRDLGVDLVEEPLGKMFPSTDRARDVLEALHGGLAAAGVQTRFGTPVREIVAVGDGWSVDGVLARRVIVATGGLSVPATGSTGFGLGLARDLGHELVPPVPALAALVGDVGGDVLAGLTVPAIVTVAERDGRVHARAAGSMLFTHVGVTGPVALDVSHAVERLADDGIEAVVTADLWTLADPAGPFATYLDAPKLPGCSLRPTPAPVEPGSFDAELVRAGARSTKQTVATYLATRLPRRLVGELAGWHAVTPLSELRREDRRRVARAVTALDVEITGTAGYPKAEVTAGGVALTDLDRTSLESRLAPGLHFCGEVCDVTGRLGGFNFQWAWTSGYLAGTGAGAAVASATSRS